MGRPRKNEDIGKPWVVRDVPEHVKRKIRVYAAQHDLTMAQAVEQLVDLALGHAVPASPQKPATESTEQAVDVDEFMFSSRFREQMGEQMAADVTRLMRAGHFDMAAKLLQWPGEREIPAAAQGTSSADDETRRLLAGIDSTRAEE